MSTMQAIISSDDAAKAMQLLNPEIPWTHHFNISGIETITQERDDKFYKKSVAAKKLGKLAFEYFKIFSSSRFIDQARVIDIASAEGGLSAEFACAGAKEVVGIEGRELYVARANFIKHAYAINNVQFHLDDVRNISRSKYGEFDFTINSGILHHLGKEDFIPFLSGVAEVTRDVMFLYTHVSTQDAVRDFRLTGPVMAAGSFEGYLLQEHPEDASSEVRKRQVRASLDNTYSFWASEESLLRALRSVGFGLVAKIMEPHIFSSYQNKNLRIILICKKI